MFERLRMANRDEGFTLVELLIVIVILGILAAVVVLAVSGISGRGLRNACKADFRTVETAQEAYYALNTAYAANTAALKTANLLRAVPSNTNYVIETGSTGVVYGGTTPAGTPTPNATLTTSALCDSLAQ